MNPSHTPSQSEILSRYQKLVNEIDDFLEYQYRGHSPEGVRDRLRAMIAEAGEEMPKSIRCVVMKHCPHDLGADWEQITHPITYTECKRYIEGFADKSKYVIMWGL